MSLVVNYLSLIYGIIAFLHIFNHWFGNILSYLSVSCTEIWVSKKVKTKIAGSKDYLTSCYNIVSIQTYYTVCR